MLSNKWGSPRNRSSNIGGYTEPSVARAKWSGRLYRFFHLFHSKTAVPETKGITRVIHRFHCGRCIVIIFMPLWTEKYQITFWMEIGWQFNKLSGGQERG